MATSLCLSSVQGCVLGFTSLLLLLIGTACMLTDALGKPVRYITDTILELMESYYSNNVMANEDFLDHLYRIVNTMLEENCRYQVRCRLAAAELTGWRTTTTRTSHRPAPASTGSTWGEYSTTEAAATSSPST